MKTLKDKAVVVTGAGGSIAGAVEEALTEAGARPILVDRDEIRIRARAESYATLAIAEDLLTAESAERAASAALGRMGRVDGLIHLVGELVPGRLEAVGLDDYERAFDSNVRTLFHTLRAFLPLLKSRDEAFIAALGAQQAFQGGSPGATLFAAAKGAAATMLRSLDAELAGTNVDVTIITPLAPIDTAHGRRALPGHGQEGWITPEAIGAAFRAAALTGQGGRMLEVPLYPPR